MAAGQDHLQGHDTVELDLPGLVDDPHSAATDDFQKFVARNLYSWDRASVLRRSRNSGGEHSARHSFVEIAVQSLGMIGKADGILRFCGGFASIAASVNLGKNQLVPIVLGGPGLDQLRAKFLDASPPPGPKPSENTFAYTFEPKGPG